MLNALMESNPDLDQLGEAELDRMVRILTFHLSVPTNWELKAQVLWEEGGPLASVYIKGKVNQRMHSVPEPYQPAHFFDLFQQKEAGAAPHEPLLTDQEMQEALTNIGVNVELGTEESDLATELGESGGLGWRRPPSLQNLKWITPDGMI